MARKNRPLLPGLSRSTACNRTKSCSRLDGHRKACRPTVTKAAALRPSVDGVEVLSADRYTVTESPRPARRVKARRPKVGQCRVVRGEVRCSRAFGHKQAGRRHSFAGVNVLPAVGPEGRDVQAQGHARRAKAAPQGTKSRDNTNALKGRI